MEAMAKAGQVAVMISAATEAEGGFVFTGKHIENLDFDGVFRRRPLGGFDAR